MNPRTRFWIASSVLAVVFDQLFWGVDHGLNFPLFALLCLAGGLAVLRQEGHPPEPSAMLLLLPVAFFAWGSFVRLEPLALGLSCAWVLAFMALFAVHYARPGWWRLGAWDTLRALVGLLATALAHGFTRMAEEEKSASPRHPGARGLTWLPPLARGLLLAVPVAGLFALLLAQADSVFAHFLARVFSFRTLAEAVFRLSYIMAGAYLLVGVLLYAAEESAKPLATTSPHDQARTRLGAIEANVVLAAVDAVFLSFVVIQLRYFFGGRAKLEELGLTYSEYARRGFGELVAVAFLSLVLLMALQGLTRFEDRSLRHFRAALTVLLVLLVGVILLSAWQRLSLYEAAYGFTRARLYAHTLMVWLGVALVATGWLQLRHRARWVPHACLASAIGFSAHLLLASIDGTVVEKNAARAEAGAPFDAAYLASLSPDAVAVMTTKFASPELSQASREALGASLVCWTWRHRAWEESGPWQELHLARWRARRALRSAIPLLSGFELHESPEGTAVRGPSSRVFACSSPRR